MATNGELAGGGSPLKRRRVLIASAISVEATLDDLGIDVSLADRLREEAVNDADDLERLTEDDMRALRLQLGVKNKLIAWQNDVRRGPLAP